MHTYRDCGIRDGVRYVISGGGGAEISEPGEEGGFEHYLLVRVRGEDVSWAVIRPGSVLPEDVMTRARLDEMRLLQDNVHSEPLEVPVGQGFDRQVTITVENPYDAPFSSTLHWETPAGWHVDPVEAAYTTAPGVPATPLFHVWTDSAEATRFPVPAVTTTIENTLHGGPVTVTKPIDFIPTITAAFAVKPVIIDGQLDEWDQATPQPLIYAADFDPKDTNDLQAQMRVLWDEGHLYLVVEVEDDEFYQPYAGDIVWSADNIELFQGDWHWSLTLTQAGPEVFLYDGPGRESETVNTAVRLAVRRDGRKTVYEADFPASEVAPLRLQEGSSYPFSIMANDRDNLAPERPRHWLEFTPGAGSGGPFPHAKVILAR
jgi:hypothetical protein